jgi:S-adenosyl methyltransferase
MMVAVLHYIPDADQPGQIAAALRDAVAPGSYLAISAAASDTGEMGTAIGAYNSGQVAAQVRLRPRAVVSGYFDGLGLVEPGLVTLERWRPAGAPGAPVPVYAGVARKPG